MIEKTEGEIRNKQSRGIGNTEHKGHKKRKQNATQKHERPLQKSGKECMSRELIMLPFLTIPQHVSVDQENNILVNDRI